jgi:DNA polymerase I-like protein with 3'-5' exonuclease and polymerase domains
MTATFNPVYRKEQKDELARIYRGDFTDVSRLSASSRRAHGLSTLDTITQVRSQKELQEAVDYVRSKKRTGFDLETDGENEDALNPWRGTIELVLMGDRERQFVIWYRYLTDLSPLHELLADSSIVKIGQNLKFDMKFWLVKHGLDKRFQNAADCGLIEQVIGCGLFSEEDDKVGMTLKMTSLKMMGRRWLGLDLVKDDEVRTGWSKFNPETIPTDKLLYAGDDVCAPELILSKQKGWIKRLGLVETVNLEHAYLPVLADMEVRGIKVNMEKWNTLADEAEQKMREARRALDTLFDVTVTVEMDEAGNCTFSRDKNYNSKDQLKDLLRDYMMLHHGISVVACNKHMKASLISNGFNPERAERLFAESKKPNPKKPGAMKKVGAPYMTDTVEALWEEYRRYLPEKCFFLPNTESKTFKLYKIIAATAPGTHDDALPSEYGLPAELVDPNINLRKYSKAAGTYGKNWNALINPKTGRLHVNFTQAALSTGRTSSNPNIQNPPSDSRYRECFEAETDKGTVFIGADWDQVEPRIIAQLSDCFAYKRVFFSKHPERAEFKVYCNGVTEALDLYTEIGKMIGVIPDHMTVLDTKGGDGKEPTKEGKKGRKQSKIVVLGLGYGTGKAKFYITLTIDLGEHQDKDFSDALFDRFWTAVPEVKTTLDRFSNLAYPGDDVEKWGKTMRKKSTRRIWHPFVESEVTWAETIGGRKRFYRKESYSWWTTGRNQPIQGTGADILKRTMVLWARWTWEQSFLQPSHGFVNAVHDELLAEVPKEHAKVCYDKLCEIMQQVGQMYCPDVPITSAGYTETYWVKD